MFKDKPAQAGGGKGGSSAYDPQIGAAAAQTAATAQQALTFSENYQTQYITPLLQQMMSQSATSAGQQTQMFNLNYAEMQQANQRYQQYGIPAENRYYDMVSKYSAPAYAEQQAGAALGDARTAEAGQAATLDRTLQSLGIDPTSPAAIQARTQAGVMNAANEAAAANKARMEARNLGMQLTSDAANFGRGGTSQTLAFGQNASGNSNSAATISQGALNSGVNGASVGLQGLNTAMNGYTANLDAYSRLGAADIQANASAGQGIGQFFGTAGAMLLQNPALLGSDRRIKEDITYVYTRPDGIKVYDFKYLGSDTVYRGVMADEVEKVTPEAVVIGPHGYKVVDYSLLR